MNVWRERLESVKFQIIMKFLPNAWVGGTLEIVMALLAYDRLARSAVIKSQGIVCNAEQTEN